MERIAFNWVIYNPSHFLYVSISMQTRNRIKPKSNAFAKSSHDTVNHQRQRGSILAIISNKKKLFYQKKKKNCVQLQLLLC